MRKIKYSLLASLFLSVLMVGCYDEEAYTPVAMLPAPTAEITLTDVEDESFVVNVTSSADGYISIVVTDDVTAVAPDGESLYKQLESGIYNTYAEVEAGASLSWTVGDINPNTMYKVFAVCGNPDGVVSEVVSAEILTSDKVNPELDADAMSPGAGASGIAADEAFVLTFNEMVKLGDAPVFTLVYYYEDVTTVVPVENIVVAGNTVTVKQTYTPHPGEIIFLSVADGSVTDLVGNPADGFETGVVDGAIEGFAYWFVETAPVDMLVSLPEAGGSTSDPNFAVTVKFDAAMTFADNDVLPVLTYFDGTGVYTIEVPGEDIVANEADSTVTFYQSVTAEIGSWVSLSIPEDVLEDMYGNPNAAIESKADATGMEGLYFLVSYGYTRDMVLGAYSALSSSYFGPADNELDAITIIADPEDENGIIMTGLRGSGEPVYGTFDGDYGTITFPAYSHIYIDANGTPETTDDVHVYFESNSGEAMVATVLPNGDISLVDIWLYTFYDMDYEYAGYDNAFSSTYFTKMPDAPLVVKSLDLSSEYRQVVPKPHKRIIEE